MKVLKDIQKHAETSMKYEGQSKFDLKRYNNQIYRPLYIQGNK